MAKQKHIHRYQKKYFPSGKPFYQCVILGCPHYSHEMYIVGKTANCWYCDNNFVVTNQQILNGQAKLHCSNCASPRGFGRQKYEQQLKNKVTKQTLQESTELANKIMEEILGNSENKSGEATAELPHELDELGNTGTE